MIQERIVQFPNRKRIIKTTVPGHTNTDGDFYADVSIDGEGNVTQAGTLITAALLNSFATKDSIYPVGSIYMSVVNVSPASFFGGTWTQWGAGRVPVGIGDNGETNYMTGEQVGGSENSIASHNHTQNEHNHSQDWHRHGCSSANNYAGADGMGKGNPRQIAVLNNINGGYGYYYDHSANSWLTWECPWIYNSTATNNAAGGVGGNRMPFITCYMWKRIA